MALSAAPLARGQATTTADVTEPGRDIARCLDVVLAGSKGSPRTLALAVDPTASLAAAGFADELARAIERQGEALATTRLALFSLSGKKPGQVVAPTTDHASVVAGLRLLLAAPGKDIENVFDDLRSLAAAAAAWPGERAALLVALDNGDAEDDLEGTVERLTRTGLRLHVLTTEAYVADSWWAARPGEHRPRGTEMRGGDAATIDLPWGYLLQITVANEVTPAAAASYALARLAAATEGRVFLFTPPVDARHQCGIYAGCLFCGSDHIQPREAYLDGRLRQVAPSCQSRSDAYRAIAGDPMFRAVLRAWSEAAKAGLVRSNPPLQLSGSTATPAPSRGAHFLPIFDSLQLDRNAKRAEKAAEDCQRIAEMLAKDLERVPDGKGLPRQRAIAELVRVQMQLVKVNLLLYAGWCREIAPVRLDKDWSPAPPEVSEIPPGRRPAGISYTNLCLCHGVTPYLSVELPGGETVRSELRALDALVNAYRERWSGTPFVYALHRSGIARFHFTYPGTVEPPPRVRPRSRSEEDPTTTGQGRPPRAPAGGTGTTPTGPTTGGGR